MGEIERINPILRPILPPKVTERVQPDSDRKQRHPDEDTVEINNTAHSEEEPETAGPSAVRHFEPGQHLDIAI